MVEKQSLRHWRSPRLLRFAGAVLLGALVSVTWPSAAVQLGDGTIAFNSPPRLDSFITFDERAQDRNTTYYVTVRLLPEAGEPLQTLSVSLIEGRFNRLNYRTEQISVYGGQPRDRSTAYPVETADYDANSQTLTIRLAQPAEPGQTLTFELELVRNPRFGGVYLYDVVAAPAGENPRFQRIGTGRIHIYDRPRRVFP
ncbi:MAG: DUF2808 domain-containing protein [Leptolyngbyaceae cyanobacterium]